jgi:Cu(I)/Ag(I) efflux system membrane protein CusA/SilA
LTDLREVIVHGSAKRLRPKFMTFATTCIGLFPIMWSIGAGSDVMRRIAAPMVGGIFTSFVLELLVYPAAYEVWKWNTELKRRLSPELFSEGATAPAELLSPSAALNTAGD